jgi:DNA modification methylase
LFTADARDLASLVPRDSIDLVVTSPPYWDLLKQRQSLRNRRSGKHLKSNYSNDRKDLSNAATLDEFLKEMGGIFYQVSEVLKPGSRLVVITGDYRRRGEYIPLHERYITMLSSIGLDLNNILIWDRSNEYDIGLFSYPRYFIAANGMVEYVMEFIHEGSGARHPARGR